jgi:hypothetical protein
MKKLLVYVLLFLGLFLATGCKEIDAVDKAVNETVSQFDLSAYITDEAINNDVLAGAKTAGLKIEEKASNLDRSNIYSLFGTVVYEKAFNKNLTSSKNSATELKEQLDDWNITTYLNVLNILGLEGKDLALEIVNKEHAYMDADTAGMLIVALSPYIKEQEVKNFIDEMLVVIKGYVSNEGVLSDWSGVNASSTAQVIIALVAIGESPRTYYDFDLIEILLTFKKDQGFKNGLNDDAPDLMFATPQSFLALTLYQKFAKQNKAIYSYSLGE